MRTIFGLFRPHLLLSQLASKMTRGERNVRRSARAPQQTASGAVFLAASSTFKTRASVCQNYCQSAVVVAVAFGTRERASSWLNRQLSARAV